MQVSAVEPYEEGSLWSPVDYVLLFVFLLAVHSTSLNALLFFLEIIFDVGFHLLELLLSVAEFPGECEADLAQRHLYRHILYIG